MTRRFLPVLVLVGALLLPACATTKNFIIAPIDSVQPLQSDERKTFCTAFSIHQRLGYWATARHCVEAAEAHQSAMFIHNEHAVIVYKDEFSDLAILQSISRAPALRLASEAPKVGAFLEVRGFPYGLPKMVTTRGIIAARHIPIYHSGANRYEVSDILDLTVAGGNSGSPVLDENGHVVGILWGAFRDAPLSVAVPWENLVRAFGSVVAILD